MNTRRKLLQAKPEKPSTRWHVMHEAFHPIFLHEFQEHVEYWYNMGATGVQRDLFRQICAEVFAEDTGRAAPTFPTEFTAASQTQEADLMIKNYGLVLSDIGKRKARVWILYNTNNRRRNNFRDVFTGCQTMFKNRSVMHTDFVHPECDAYNVDRTHFVRAVDWTSLNARDEMQNLQSQRQPDMSLDKRLSLLYADKNPKERITKPKSQFDKVNPLVALGYGDAPAEEAIAELKAQRDAHQQAEQYYVDADGSTVYKAVDSKKKRTENSTQGGGILASVTSDPISEWKVKVCN